MLAQGGRQVVEVTLSGMTVTPSVVEVAAGTSPLIGGSPPRAL